MIYVIVTITIALYPAWSSAVDLLMIKRHEHLPLTTGMKLHLSDNTTSVPRWQKSTLLSHPWACRCILYTVGVSRALTVSTLANYSITKGYNQWLFVYYLICTCANVYVTPGMGLNRCSLEQKKCEKQEGILSFILIRVLIQITESPHSFSIGCHLGHLSYAYFGYASDVNLLAPLVGALQDLMTICEDFAKAYYVISTDKKDVGMCIGENGYWTALIFNN